MKIQEIKPMEKSRIFLSPPHMGEKELEYVLDVFRSNWMAPVGPHITAFEEAICRLTGAEYGVALSSGTAAIHLALILAGVERGDEVICQSLTFAGSAFPVLYQGAVPVFIDSEPGTWNMDPGILEEAIRERQRQGLRVKAILPVHLYGMPARMDEIMEISRRYEIPVIEDAAEALGSLYKGRHLGTDGLMGILSFNGNKIITTTGGGMLVSRNRQLMEKARFLSTQARDEAPHYEHSQLGFNYRMSNLLAGVGLGQLSVLQERVRARRHNFRKYQQYFRELKMRGFHVRMCHEPTGFFSNRWLTVILVDPGCCQGVTREKLRLAFGKARIETRPMWKPMHLQPLFREAPCYGGRISERLFDQGLCLPSGSALTPGEFERILRVMNSVFRAPVTGRRAFKRHETVQIAGNFGSAPS